MTPKERAAMQQALAALGAMLTHMGMDEDEWTKPTFDQARVAITTLREALAEQHKPHEECECSDCLNYFTDKAHEEALEQPVSQQYQDHLVNQSFDWEAMAAKHQFMEGYRIGLAEMREKCATVCEELDLDWRGLESRIDCAAAIRAIKFEGDTGFRPVSEMIAEHKQDHKKGAAIEKAKMRKATRAVIEKFKEKNK